jgi:hypothetical protein
MRRSRSTPQAGVPLTPERARQGYRAVRRAVLASVAVMWLIVVYVALAMPRLLDLVGGFAVLQLLWTPFLLRYLKRDIDRRTVRSQDLPDIGL